MIVRDDTLLKRVDNIPASLRGRPQWVCWSIEDRGGKPTKVPMRVDGQGRADSTSAETWATYADALAAFEAGDYAGIGFVFSPDDAYVGVDLDDCIVDGAIAPEAQAIIDSLATYTEVSPSGNGVKIIGIGAKPGAKCRTKDVHGFGEIEMYDHDRFFTITGDIATSCRTLNDCGKALAKVYWSLLSKAPVPRPKPATRPTVASPAPLDIIEHIRRSKQGDKFERLWSGNTGDYGGDDSAADMALCSILAFWCQGNAGGVDRMFRMSGLMRSKWDAKRGGTTYGRITTEKAVAGCTEFYTPQPSVIATPPAMIPADVPQPMRSASDMLEKRLVDIIEGRFQAIPFKWPQLSAGTKAMMPGTLTVICGNPGATKSFWLLENLAHWHENGIAVAAMMLEDGREYHLQRATAQRVGDARMTDPDWIEECPDEALAYRDHTRKWADSFGECLHEPSDEADVTHDMLAAWCEAQAANGKRIVCIDPISIAGGTDKQFIDDRKFIAKVKQIAKRHQCSVLLVTHPKKHAEGATLDDVSGGASITRFAPTVIWLRFLAEHEHFTVMNTTLNLRESVSANRVMHIPKARNGRGTGAKIAYEFHPKSLTFSEHGVVVKDHQ